MQHERLIAMAKGLTESAKLAPTFRPMQTAQAASSSARKN
jgi:hypothetical protein